MPKSSAAKQVPPPAAPPVLPESAATTELRKVEGAIAEIGSVGAGLLALKEKFAGIVYDVSTPEGMARAKADRAEIREPRYKIEQIRKAAKAPLLTMGRLLDGEAARIEGEILALERNPDTAIKAEEARVEAERAAKVEAERQRLLAIEGRIQRIRDATRLEARTAEQTQKVIDALEALAVDDSFAELQQQAADAKTASLSILRAAYETRLAFEAEQVRVKQQAEENARRQAELDRQEAEAVARRRAEDDAAATTRAQAQARLDEQAEALRQQEAALKAQREALKPAPAVSLSPELVEADDAPAAAVEAQASEPSPEQIVDALVDAFEVDAETALYWLCRTEWAQV